MAVRRVGEKKRPWWCLGRVAARGIEEKGEADGSVRPSATVAEQVAPREKGGKKEPATGEEGKGNGGELTDDQKRRGRSADELAEEAARRRRRPVTGKKTCVPSRKKTKAKSERRWERETPRKVALCTAPDHAVMPAFHAPCSGAPRRMRRRSGFEEEDGRASPRWDMKQEEEEGALRVDL